MACQSLKKLSDQMLHATLSPNFGATTQVAVEIQQEGGFFSWGWAALSDITGMTVGSYGCQDEIIVAVSDETTDITTGTAKMTFYCPRAYKLIKVKASLNAITSGTCSFTVKNGATTLTTVNCSSTGLASSNTLNADLASGDGITIDIDGTFAGAKGGKVYFVWYATGAA